MSGDLGVLLPGVLGELRKQTRAKLYFSRPDLWASDFAGFRLTEKQIETVMSVANNHDTAVKAAHSVGKSFSAALLICWWIDTRLPLGTTFVASTAPDTARVNAIVWREVRRVKSVVEKRHGEYLRRLNSGEDLGEYVFNDHVLPGYVTADAHWRLEDGTEIGYGRKPPESKDDAMVGIHAEYVFSLGDEACSLSAGLIDDLGNITSNDTSRRLLIGNPVNPLSYFAKLFREPEGVYNLITISVFSSPNFHGNKFDENGTLVFSCECHPSEPYGLGFPEEALRSMVDPGYVEKKKREYGSENDPRYIARVLGEFAWDQGPTLISMEDISVGIDTHLTPSGRGVLGVDVARYGDDLSVAYHYDNGVLRLVESWGKTSGPDTARKINDIAIGLSVTEVRIDGSGLGGPIADQLFEIANGRYDVIEMIGGARSPDRNRWYNMRAFWFDSFANRLRQRGIDLDYTDEQLQDELMGIEYKFPKAGVQSLLIESKDDMRRRGVGSPDFADAAIYAAADISNVTNSPFKDFDPGSKIRIDPWVALDMHRHDAGMPI